MTELDMTKRVESILNYRLYKTIEARNKKRPTLYDLRRDVVVMKDVDMELKNEIGCTENSNECKLYMVYIHKGKVYRKLVTPDTKNIGDILYRYESYIEEYFSKLTTLDRVNDETKELIISSIAHYRAKMTLNNISFMVGNQGVVPITDTILFNTAYIPIHIINMSNNESLIYELDYYEFNKLPEPLMRVLLAFNK